MNPSTNRKKMDIDGNSLMHHAAKDGDIEEMKRLHEQGWSLLDIDDRGLTLLHTAARWGHFQVAEYLVENNCDVNVRDRSGQTPVLIAARFEKKEVVELLVRSGADLTGCSRLVEWTLLHHASYFLGWTEIAQMIVENGSLDVNAKTFRGETPLMLALEKGHEEVAKLLLEAGADCRGCDEEGKNVLHYVCGSMQECSGCHDKKKNVLHYACCSMQECSGCHDKKKNVRHCACMKSSRSMKDLKTIVKHIIEKEETDLNAESVNKWTPLLYAADDVKKKDIVEILIRAGADVHRYPSTQQSVQYLAVSRGWTDIVHLIVKKKDLDRTNKRGLTFLHMVCQHFPEFSEVLKLLIRTGTDVNIKSISNATALSTYLLSRCHNYDIDSIKLITMLVKNGAYIGAVENQNLSWNPSLKELVLSDEELCTLSLINQFNQYSLPAVYAVPAFRAQLPPMDALTINTNESKLSESMAEQEIAKLVHSEIKTKAICDVLKARPIVLKLLCVEFLIKNKPTVKRSASPAMNIAKKRCLL